MSLRERNIKLIGLLLVSFLFIFLLYNLKNYISEYNLGASVTSWTYNGSKYACPNGYTKKGNTECYRVLGDQNSTPYCAGEYTYEVKYKSLCNVGSYRSGYCVWSSMGNNCKSNGGSLKYLNGRWVCAKSPTSCNETISGGKCVIRTAVNTRYSCDSYKYLSTRNPIKAKVNGVKKCIDVINATNTTTNEKSSTKGDNTPITSSNTSSSSSSNYTTTSYNISNATISKIKDQKYTGKKIKPKPTVTLKGITLTKGTDYKLQYSNNKKIGIAKVKIIGIGNYTGSKIVKFRIYEEMKQFEGEIKQDTPSDTLPSEDPTNPQSGEPTITPTQESTPGKVKIKIDVNGGTVNTNSYGYTKSGSLVLQNGNEIIDSAKYGGTLGKYGLTDPNSKTKLNITRKGYKIVKGKEFKCKSGCTTNGKIFDKETQYKASDFCDASKGDCIVILEVNWKKK